MTHRDRAGDASGQRAGKRDAASGAGHRQGLPAPAGGSPARPKAVSQGFRPGARGAAMRDLLDLVAKDLELTESKRRNLACSIRKFGEHLSFDLHMPANFPVYRGHLKRFHLDNARISNRSWANIKLDVAFALERYGAPKTWDGPHDLLPAWQALCVASSPSCSSREKLVEAGLRGLFDEIRHVPRNGQLDIYLVGNLAAILDLCAKKNPGARDAGVHIALVAGAGFEPATFRL